MDINKSTLKHFKVGNYYKIKSNGKIRFAKKGGHNVGWKYGYMRLTKKIVESFKLLLTDESNSKQQ